MDYSSFCSGSWGRITSEATCIAAAADLGLKWAKSWDGFKDFPGCLHTKDERNSVYFNTSPNPSNNPNANYAEICQPGIKTTTTTNIPTKTGIKTTTTTTTTTTNIPTKTGEWGEWSESPVGECDRLCGGGKKRFKMYRKCSLFEGCTGDFKKYIKKDCNSDSCRCNKKGNVERLCSRYPITTTREEQRIFCDFEVEEMREALLCDQISSESAAILLNAVFDKQHGPGNCLYDPIDVLNGDCGQQLQDKLEKNVIDKKLEVRQKMDEASESTNEIYEEKIGEVSIMESLKKAQLALVVLADANTQYQKIEEEQDKILTEIYNNADISENKKKELKGKVYTELSDTKLDGKTINGAKIELATVSKKATKLKSDYSDIKKYFKEAKIKLKGMSKTAALENTAATVGHVLNSIPKFKKGDTLSVLSGTMDIANGIAVFAGPKAMIITSAVSSILSIFIGGGPSIEDIIKDEFKKQKKYLDEKFDEIDKSFVKLEKRRKDQYNELKGILDMQFGKIKNVINDEFGQMEIFIDNKLKNLQHFLFLKSVSDRARSGMARWEALEGDLEFLYDNERISHEDEAINSIIRDIDIFGDEVEKIELRKFVEDECRNQEGKRMREYCQNIALSVLMMDRLGEIILSKIIVFKAKSSLSSIDYTGILKRRKEKSLEFLKLVFTSTKEEEYSYISCGISDSSSAKLDAERKANLFEYADHLDPSLTLRRKLEQRSSCVDGQWSPEWIDVTNEKKSLKNSTCCKQRERTQTKACSKPQNGGVDCTARPTKCLGSAGTDYCPGNIYVLGNCGDSLAYTWMEVDEHDTLIVEQKFFDEPRHSRQFFSITELDNTFYTIGGKKSSEGNYKTTPAITNLTPGQWGSWGNYEKCEYPYFVNSMELRIANYATDLTGLNTIRLQCSSPGRKQLTSTEGHEGSWRTKQVCPAGLFMVGAQVRYGGAKTGCPKGICTDNTAANGVKFVCSDASQSKLVPRRPGEFNRGDWKRMRYCKKGSAVIGLKTKVQPKQGSGHYGGNEDTALNDVKFACAEIPYMYIDTVDKFDPDRKKWTNEAELTKSRFSHAAVASGSNIIVLGGYIIKGYKEGYKEVPTDSVERYDISSRGWTTLTSMSQKRVYFGAVEFKGEIYAIGGKSQNIPISSMEIYNPLKNTWRNGLRIPTQRYGLAAATLNGKIYVTGGFNFQLQSYFLNDVAVYNGIVWKSIGNMQVSRAFHTLINNGGNLMAVGGRSGSVFAPYDVDSIEEYNYDLDSWSIKKKMQTCKGDVEAVVVF